MSGQFVISLDFELLWGVRDHSDKHAYGQNILGAREESWLGKSAQ